MHSITTVLIVLVAVVLSGGLARVLPWPLPLPLVQIAFGALIAWTLNISVTLNPEIFFLLFLPPLLFLDGWRIPKLDLLRDMGAVLELALGLVVFTVIGLGFFIHWLIPAMPLAVAFALAAVLSPTDPIAVSAIAGRVQIPKRMMRVLEGESLLNDASGLVCLRFAVAAALTGTFSLTSALGTFLWLALGGIGVGVCVAWSASRLIQLLAHRYGADEGSSILTSILIPFGAYLLAEHIQASGILAAVSAGVTMTFVEDPLRAPAVTRIRRGVIWDMIQFALNGAIFVILGEQIPKILERAAETVRQSGEHHPYWLGVYVIAITAVLAAGRFAWVWVSLRFGRRRDRPTRRPSWRLVAATSLSGVKGAITLAGILTLPLTLADGAPFPARSLAIFIAAGVIILSLIAATIGLPMLLKGLEFPLDDRLELEADQARVAAASAGIKAVETALQHMKQPPEEADIYSQAGADILAFYRARLERPEQGPEAVAAVQKLRAVERDLFRAGLEAERKAVLRLTRERKIGDEAMRKVIREIDLFETRMPQ